MKLLFESDRYMVTSNGRDGQPVVTFHPMRTDNSFHLHRNNPWMGKQLNELGYNCIAVTSSHNDWFQHPDIYSAIYAINAYLVGIKPVTLGASMGGSGAWMFADALNALGWVGFSALSYAPEAEFDPRRMEERNLVKSTHGWLPESPLPSNGIAIFDPAHTVDRIHAERLKERNPEICLMPIEGCTHAPLVHFHRKKELSLMLYRCIERIRLSYRAPPAPTRDARFYMKRLRELARNRAHAQQQLAS